MLLGPQELSRYRVPHYSARLPGHGHDQNDPKQDRLGPATRLAPTASAASTQAMETWAALDHVGHPLPRRALMLVDAAQLQRALLLHRYPPRHQNTLRQQGWRWAPATANGTGAG